MVQRSARNSFGYDASSLLSLKYQSLSITKFYCKRILLIIQVLRNKLTPLQIVITNGYTCSIFQVAKITKKGVWLCSLFC